MENISRGSLKYWAHSHGEHLNGDARVIGSTHGEHLKEVARVWGSSIEVYSKSYFAKTFNIPTT